MTNEKFVRSDAKYLDLAKNITSVLHDMCIESKEEYNIPTVIAGVSIGFYMFIKELANLSGTTVKKLLETCNGWFEFANNIFDKES